MCTNFLLGLCWTKCSAECSITNEIFAQMYLVLHVGSFRQFETAYNEIVEAVLPVITNSTGCFAPCSYKEYRFTGAASEAGVTQFSSCAISLNFAGAFWYFWLCAVEHVSLCAGGDRIPSLQHWVPGRRVWGNSWPVSRLLLYGPLGWFGSYGQDTWKTHEQVII